MLDGIKRNLRLRRYANFWDYLRDPQNFSLEELRAIANDPLEGDLRSNSRRFLQPTERLMYFYSTGKRVPLTPFERGVLESGEHKRTQEEIQHIELGRGRELLTLKETVHQLYTRFESEIWRNCAEEAGFDFEKGRSNTLARLATLKWAAQVQNQGTLEVFLVREALRSAAKHVLQERRDGAIQDQESQADKP